MAMATSDRMGYVCILMAMATSELVSGGVEVRSKILMAMATSNQWGSNPPQTPFPPEPLPPSPHPNLAGNGQAKSPEPQTPKSGPPAARFSVVRSIAYAGGNPPSQKQWPVQRRCVRGFDGNGHFKPKILSERQWPVQTESSGGSSQVKKHKKSKQTPNPKAMAS